jgi:hypothetical protein
MRRALEGVSRAGRPVTTVVAIAVVGLTLSLLWVHASHYYYLPCETDCGETIIAQDQVALYRLNGFKHGLIQYETVPTGDLLYTHNVHIGAVMFVLLDAVGVRPFWGKQLVTLLAFGLGLLYVFGATSYYSRSGVGGLIVLVLFCLDYEHVLSFGLNALRAWHWLALFGLAFHIGRVMLEPRPRAIDGIAILVLSAVAFGIGYDFWLICGSVAALIVLVSLYRAPKKAGTLTRGGWVLGSLLLPVAIRQIQIAAVLGVPFWKTDLYYSIGIKVPGMNRLLRLPSLDEIDAFYRASGVLRPPASPATSFSSVLDTFVDMLDQIVVPGWGLLFCVIALAVALIATGDVICYRWERYRSSRIGAFFGRTGARGWYLLIAPLSVGSLFGLALLAPFSLHVYLKHAFPLLAATILLPAGFCLWLAAESLLGAGRRRRRVAITASIICLLLSYYALIQVNNARTATGVDRSWIGFLLGHSQAAYALPDRPLLYHGERVDWIRVDPSHVPTILKRAERGQPLFEGLVPPGMEPRDYWIYQPLDSAVEFDAPVPSCRRQDPALAALAWLGEKLQRAPGKSASWIVPGRVPPGSRVVLGGTIDAPRRLIDRIEVVHMGVVHDVTAEHTIWSVTQVKDAAEPIGNVAMNCLRGTFIAGVAVGERAVEGLHRVSIRAAYRDGRKYEIGRIIFEVQDDAPRTTPLAIPTSHLSVDAVVRASSGLAIAAKSRTGSGYVIFDLKRSKTAAGTREGTNVR